MRLKQSKVEKADLLDSETQNHDTEITSEETVLTEISLNVNQMSHMARLISHFRGFLGIIGVVLACLLAIFSLIVIFWHQISDFLNFNDFASPQAHFVHVESMAADALADNIAGSYGKLLARVSSGKLASKCDLQIELSEQIIQQINANISAKDISNESWLQDISLSMTSNRDYDNYCSMFSLDIGGRRIITPNCYWNTSQNKIWFSIPEISKSYLQVHTDEFSDPFFRYAGLTWEDISSFISLLPSEQVLNQLIDKYLNLILHQITDVESAEKMITVGELSQQCTVLTATISERQWICMIISILEFVKEDELITGIYEDISPTSIKEINLNHRIDEIIDELNIALDEAREGNFIQWIDYVNSSDQVVGRRIRASGSDKELYYCVLFDNHDVCCEFNLFDVISTAGTGCVSGVLLNARFQVYSDQKPLCTIEVEDFNCRQFTSGRVDGRFCITAEENTSGKFAYELDIEQKKDSLYLQIDSLINDESAIKVSLNYREQDPKDIHLPNEFFSLHDEDDLIKWIKTVNMEPLIRNLERAGVPDVFIVAISDYWDKLSSLQ